MNSNRINWQNLAEDAKKYQDTGTSGDFGTSNYLKIAEGVHRLRIVPAGNDEEELPYKRFIRHEIQVQGAEGKRTHFILCLNYVKENKASIARPLANAQRLRAEDVKLIKQFGCPACNAMEAMQAAGNVPKETFLRLKPSIKFIWNVISRADGALYIWNTSMTLGGSILAMINELVEEKINPLDSRRGYDFQIRATGNGLARRYKDGMFLPVSKPLIKGGDSDSIQPYNLTEIVCGQYKTYQEVVDIVSDGYGSTLARIGFEFAGDQNNWDRTEREDDEEEEELTFAKSPKRITKKDTTPADDFFNDAVPPSDEEEEEKIFNRRKSEKANKTKKKTEKPKRKPVVEEVEDATDDDDGFDWDD